MDLRQLQAVIAIADHGSFSGAASALRTVQSNVSSHVARLEKELGVQLVDRQAGELTEEGAAVVERGRRIAAELEAMVADVAALRNEVSGPVRFGMIGTTARWLAPLLLRNVARIHPKVRLVIGEGTLSALEPRLVNGTLDLAVLTLPVSNPDLVERSFFDEDLLLVVAHDHPLADRGTVQVSDLQGVPLLLPAPGTPFREELDDAARSAGDQSHAAGRTGRLAPHGIADRAGLRPGHPPGDRRHRGSRQLRESAHRRAAPPPGRHRSAPWAGRAPRPGPCWSSWTR